MIKNKPVRGWKGKIHVDKIDDGNEDPYVFNDPWLYSYCHASQLRRSQTTENHVAKGSWLFFVSGQEADKGLLAFDTVFRVGDQQAWYRQDGEIQLPLKYRNLRRSRHSLLYQKHFCWPIEHDAHQSVTFTYEAEPWSKGKEAYSFLPLDLNMQKVAIRFSELPAPLSELIEGNVYGKYPVLLTERQVGKIRALLESRVEIKVVSNISLLQERKKSSKGHYHSKTC